MSVIAYLVSLLPSTSSPGAIADTRILFDFRVDAAENWIVVNDGVMGGLSQSSFTKPAAEFASFTGEVSLRNNGGFASVRTRLTERLDASAERLDLRVRGDGRTYQVRLRTDGNLDGIAYRTEVATEPGEWITVSLPLADFEPVFRGRRLVGVPVLRAEDVQQLGLMIADKREGRFRLDVKWIRAAN